jgi:NADP-dependent 3-hydroxy acid dehydrogenase YdfG
VKPARGTSRARARSSSSARGGSTAPGRWPPRYAVPADSFARMVVFAMSQPEDVDVNEILFRPTKQEL